MSEKFFENFSPKARKSGILREMETMAQDRSPAEAAKSFLERTNVRVKFAHEKDATFAEDRKKLSSEPGLIISNHQGTFDTVAIMQAVGRDDLKIMARPNVKEKFGKIFGDDRFISVGKTFSDLRKTWPDTEKQVLDYIKQGGVVLIYPGGLDKPGKDNPWAGFRRILEKLSAADMIYGFNFDGQAVAQAIDKIKNPVKVLLRGVLSATEINVRESYTTVDEWQKIIKENKYNAEIDAKLKTRYKRLFDNSLK
ncbi:1-acyl-sn-glycerol-3-phosphate acyltransferase [Candidatus Uhrbacteria bacterium]|nr:1-acyl-sn-glycerol-3-phosphate acyltransferase [Candidatus Uhrbacteria bacterium]